jgi:hypothetical protein
VFATGGRRNDSVTLCPVGGGTCRYPVRSVNVDVITIAGGQPVAGAQGRLRPGRWRAVVTVAFTST